MDQTAAMNGTAAMELPVLYRRPIPSEPATCAGLKVHGDSGARFAATVSTVSLGLDEIFVAQASFPVVLSLGANPAILGVLGLVAGVNLFVGPDGKWLPRAYIPAYIRRYPFIMASVPDTDRLVLCIDRDAESVTEDPAGGGAALFENGAPTAYADRMLAFSHAVHQQIAAAGLFAKALAESGLLTPQNAEIVLPDGRKLNVTGFQVVDEARFNALPDATYLEWRRLGWVALIHAMLLSQSRWAHLLEIAGDRPA